MSGKLKEVRERIKSVQSTQQITKAMKMVSAAKLRKAQQAVQQMRPYSEKLNAMLVNILSNLEGDVSTTFGQQREVESALMVVVTSNRGLCGAFNSNVIKAAVRTIDEQFAGPRSKGKLSILCIGKRGHDYFKKRYTDCTIISTHVTLVERLNFENASAVALEAMDGFESKDYDAIAVAYGFFKNAGVQYPKVEQFLPVARLDKSDGENKTRADYIFEPDKNTLLEHLVPSILKTQFFKFVLDTHASEHGARMTAMDKATENANELMRELRITYNKARQEAITKELSEIVGGAAALEGG